jgi:SAM-dependent methyltransferase
MIEPTETHKEVQKHYGEYARTGSSCCGPQNNFYPLEAIQQVPSDISQFSAGSGDPVTPAALQPGETVLDLGSGGGLDCFLAARQVGDAGHVIGVDMTPEMIDRARSNAARLGLASVEFRQGYLEALPVDDAAIDVVISNCVVNLAPDKSQVLREIFRVLKPGGRLSISDIVTNRPVPGKMQENSGEWCGCVSGALPLGEYTAALRAAGFEQIVFKPDIAAARQAIIQGQYQAPPGMTDEQALQALEGWEHRDRNIFLPHLISARKPV